MLNRTTAIENTVAKRRINQHLCDVFKKKACFLSFTPWFKDILLILHRYNPSPLCIAAVYSFFRGLTVQAAGA